MAKAIELILVDQNSDKEVRACYDANAIAAISELKRAGKNHTVAVLAPGAVIEIAEPYEAFRKRWLEARDNQEVMPYTAPVKPSLVV